jgi:hypothetical protein
MDEAQIQEYINKAITSGLRGALGEFKGYFTEQLSPINERLSQFEAASAAPTPAAKEQDPASPLNAALMERLAKMEKAEQARTAELHQMKINAALGNAVGKYNPMHQELVKELLTSRYGAKAFEKEGEYYLPNGAKLGEEIDSFFGSEVGQHFLANPSNSSVGAKPSGKLPSTPKKSIKDMTAEEMMLEGFSDF